MQKAVLTLALAGLVVLWVAGRPLAAQAPPPLALFFEAASSDAVVADRALKSIASSWRPGYTAMLIDMARFLNPVARDRAAGAPERRAPDLAGGPPANDPIIMPLEVGPGGPPTMVHPAAFRRRPAQVARVDVGAAVRTASRLPRIQGQRPVVKSSATGNTGAIGALSAWPRQ